MKDNADETPLTTPMTTPASAETIAEMAHDMAKTRLIEMPSDCATCWSNAVARIARPIFENLKNQAKPIITAIEIIGRGYETRSR